MRLKHYLKIVVLWIGVCLLWQGSLFAQQPNQGIFSQGIYTPPAHKVTRLRDEILAKNFAYLKPGFKDLEIDIKSSQVVKFISQKENRQQDRVLPQEGGRQDPILDGALGSEFDLGALNILTNYSPSARVSKRTGNKPIKQTIKIKNMTNSKDKVQITLRSKIDAAKVIWNGKTYNLGVFPLKFKAKKRRVFLAKDIPGFPNYYLDVNTGTVLSFYTKDKSFIADYSWGDVADLEHYVRIYKKNGSTYLELVLNNISISAQQTYTIDPLYDLATTTNYNLQFGGAVASDYLGKSVAAGDVNADGYADLIMGAYQADTNRTGAGAVYVVYSTLVDNYTTTGNNLDLANTNYNLRFGGAGVGDSLGESVAAGDVNADGYPDLIMGAFLADPNSRSASGAVYVVYSTLVDNYTTTGNNLDLANTSNYHIQFQGSNDSANLGSSCAAGDVNADGYADLIMGAYLADTNRTTAGAVYIVYSTFIDNYTTTGNNLDLASTNYNLRFGGAVTNNYLGSAVAAGDVNADGYPDLIMGAYQVDANRTSAGAVYVVYSTFLDDYTTTGNNLDLASTNYNLRFGGAVVGDNLGRSVAADDVNADGYADLIMGAYLADTNRTTAGAVYVVYSTFIDNYTTTGNNLDLATTTNFQLRFGGAVASDYLGRSVAAGDVNADGYPDLIMGAYFADPNRTTAGAVYVVYSTNYNRTPYNDTANIFELGSNTSKYELRFGGAVASDNLGSSVAAGDVNADGYADLIMGAYLADTNRTGAGAVYVVYSTLVDDWTTTGNNLDLATTSNYNLRFGGAVANDQLGSSVAAGDVNADGYPDLIMGADYADISRTNAGAVYVVYSTLIDDWTTTGNNLDLASTNYNLRFGGAVASDFLGSYVAAGDVNADGFVDLIMGAYFADISRTNAGGVYVVYSTLIDDWTTTGNNLDLASTNYNLRFGGAVASDNLGFSCAAGDVNADGLGDLIMGAYQADPNSLTNAGAVYVAYSTLIDDYTTTGNNLDLATTSNYNLQFQGAAVADNLGSSCAAGDVNADGNGDLLMGAYQADISRTNAGAVYVVYSTLIDNYTTTGNNLDLASTNYNLRFGGAAANTNLGSSCAAGDVNADGWGDLIMGAELADFSRTNAGGVYVVYSTLIDNWTTTGNSLDLATITNYNLQFQGAVAGDNLGRSVAAGDVNADGYPDLIMGAYNADTNRTTAGAVYVVFNYADNANVPMTSKTSSTITVDTQKFKLVWDAVNAGGGIDEWYDKSDSVLENKVSTSADYNSLISMEVNSGFNTYRTTGDDISAGLDKAFEIFEVDSVRAKVHIRGAFEQVGSLFELGGTTRVDYEWTVYPTGKLGLKSLRTTSDALLDRDEFKNAQLTVSDSRNFNLGSQTDDTMGLGNPSTDDEIHAWSKTAGVPNREADAALIAYSDWLDADTVGDVSLLGYKGVFWQDTATNQSWSAPSLETWYHLLYLEPKIMNAFNDTNLTYRRDDYRSPDTLSYGAGSQWAELGSDDFNEAEACYTMNMDGDTQTLTFDIDGSTTVPRYDPVFKIRQYRSLYPPGESVLSLEGTYLEPVVQYNAAVKPFTNAYFYNDPFYTTLAAAGLPGSTSEYLNKPDKNYQLVFDAAGDYLYLGSDSQFSGINIDLAIPGAGTAALQWQYYNGFWTNFTPSSAAAINNLTADGTIYWTPFTDWTTVGVNLTTALYYVRANLSSGSFTTYPIENLMKTDILLMQYFGTITSSNQTFEIIGPTLVKLVSFAAIGKNSKVELVWKTASEYNNAGFELYRSQDINGPYKKINSALIPGLGTSLKGKVYSYIDSNVTNGKVYYYKLEDVEFSGGKTIHGPVAAYPGKDTDNDGITDDWEIYYGLNPLDPNDAAQDPDEDGVTNLEEFLLGTDPHRHNNPSEPPPGEPTEGISIISQDETGITLELITSNFQAIPKIINGTTYQELKIPGYIHGWTEEAGKPRMPVKPILLGMPLNTTAVIQDLDFEKVELADYNIEPVLEYRLEPEKGQNIIVGENASFKNIVKLVPTAQNLDLSFYSQDTYYPNDIVNVSYVGDIRGQRIASIDIYPFTFNPLKQLLNHYKRLRFRVAFEPSDEPPESPPPILPNAAKLKLYTQNEGLHRVTWDALWNAGFYDILWQDPRLSSLFNQGKEIAMRVVGEEDGIFNSYDYIEFYALPNTSKYSKQNVYWLGFKDEFGKRMDEVLSSAEPAQDTPDRFKCKTHRQNNELYWPERIGDEWTDRWFENSYIWGGTTMDYTINLKEVNLLHPQDNAKLKVSCYALFKLSHEALFYLNGSLVGEGLWQGQNEYILDVEVPHSQLVEGDNTISIEARLASGVQYDVYVPDYFEVEYWRNFKAYDDVLDFSYKSDKGGVTQFNIVGFSKENLELFDITEPEALRYISGFEVVYQSDGSYRLAFKYDFQAGAERRFLALSQDKEILVPSLKLNTPSHLRATENQADYLIISYGDFKDSLQPLKNLYRKKGLKVQIVDIEDVYDQFNYGLSSPYAIKRFLSYTYNKWARPAPTYVLLVGDANYDYRDYLGTGKINYLPTYLLPNTPFLGETASDNWLACLDGEQDFLPDMFLGRIPARNTAEVDDVVQKIRDYIDISLPRTREPYNNIILAADDEFIFESASDSLLAYLPAGIGPKKMYLGSYSDYSQWTAELMNNINNGTLLLNYNGHGSITLWTEEELFNTQDIGLLDNYRKYPFVASFTCLDGYFLHLEDEYDSLAETFLRRKDAGAIACFSPTGMGMPAGHKILNEQLFGSIFTDGKIKLGPATTQAKLNLFSRMGAQYKDLIQTYTLFGDPALSLNVPREKPKPSPQSPPGLSSLPQQAQPSESEWQEPTRLYKSASISSSALPLPQEALTEAAPVSPPKDEFEELIKGSVLNYEHSKKWKDTSKQATSNTEESQN